MDALKPILLKLSRGETLPSEDTRMVFEILLNGEATNAQIGAFLMALQQRGETIEDIAAGAAVMRQFATAVNAPDGAIDTCGTGGDKSGTYNISTAVGLVVAACGVPVAKHGNRALSSKSGAAQVLEALGVRLTDNPATISRCIHEAGIGFMFAPHHHTAMRHVGPVRQELAHPTIFNLLGPLSNPAGAKRQLLGVFDRKWCRPFAQVLRTLGSETAWIVHGEDGLDELTTTGESHVAALTHGEIEEFTITPEEAGLSRAAPDELKGGSPEENAAAMRDILAGAKNAYRDIVLLNSAAALIIAEKAASLSDGVERAAAALDSGQAQKTLDNLVRLSQK